MNENVNPFDARDITFVRSQKVSMPSCPVKIDTHCRVTPAPRGSGRDGQGAYPNPVESEVQKAKKVANEPRNAQRANFGLPLTNKRDT